MASDLKFVRALYKKLLALYPQTFREQLGESMVQTFDDLTQEWKQRSARGCTSLILGVFIDTGFGIVREHVHLATQGEYMHKLLSTPRSAALISLFLCLPLVVLLPIGMLQIQPFYRLLTPLFTQADGHRQSVLGLSVILGAVLLLPAALVISTMPVLQAKRAGQSLFTHPTNLIIAAAIVLVLLALAGGIIVDQYPCWIGVPNCD